MATLTSVFYSRRSGFWSWCVSNSLDILRANGVSEVPKHGNCLIYCQLADDRRVVLSIWKELIYKFINIFDSSGDGAIGLEVLKQRVP